MKLTQIQLKNFRGYKDVQTNIDQFTAFVGNNSSGKSTILVAIQKLVDSKDKLTVDDFYMRKAQSLEIQGRFELSEEERTTLSQSLGIPLEELVLIRSAEIDDPRKSRYYAMVPQYGDKLLDPSYVSSKTVREYKEAAKDGRLPEKFASITKVGDIKQALAEYLLGGTVKPSGQKRMEVKIKDIAPLLPEVLYVPAFESIDNHTEYKKTNFFGRMLQNVFRNLEEEPDYKRFRTQYENLTQRIFGHEANNRARPLVDFENSLTSYINEILPTEVSLNFNVPLVEDVILKNFSIYLDDGVKTPVSAKGHGAQRAIVWALLRYYLDNSGSGNEPMFLVEEPELYLHPQAQRVMLKTIKELSTKGQVIYSTHSPIFVDLEHPSSIRVIRKADGNGSIYQLPDVSDDEKQQLRYLKWMGDAHSEIFFAKSVILYEGATEKLLLTHMNKNPTTDLGDVQLQRRIKRPLNFDELGCQLISTGGKFSMPFFTKLLSHAQIPFYVIFDNDSSSSTSHVDVNTHIKRNVEKARKEGLNSGHTIHYPFLEKDWKIQYSSEQKVDTVYGLLSAEDWDSYFREKYETLSSKLYNFAWCCYLNVRFS